MNTSHVTSKRLSTLRVPCLGLILLLTLYGSPAATAQKPSSAHNFTVLKNLDIFNALYRELDLYYVDTLDAKKNIDNALAYMLELIDPYTEYYPEREEETLRAITTGE